MATAIGMHDEHAGFAAGLFHHVGQVMAIAAGEGRTQNDQVKGARLQSLFDGLASGSLLDCVTGLFHGGSLLRQNCFIYTFAIKNS